MIYEGMKEHLEASDLVVFAYPVYTFLAPSQLHRTIAFLKEKKTKLQGKYMTQITTSKHFYDVTAHRYIEDNAMDMGMKVIRGLSADMADLLTREGQKDAREYWEYVLNCIREDCYENQVQNKNDKKRKTTAYHAMGIHKEHSQTKRVVIVTDYQKGQDNLKNMIVDFRSKLPYETTVVNLRKMNIRGGCLGCFHCAKDGKCIYTDHFDSFLRNRIQTNDAIVYAFAIEDHSMGSLFKMYDDRQFCNGHRTVTMGIPMAYLISGNYEEEQNLRMVVEARAEVGGNYLSGVATDEGSQTEIDHVITALTKKLSYAMEHHYQQPRNFYGVGGMKIFRDLIYVMRGLMKEDHRFYKEHGMYDFPQKQIGTRIGISAVGMLLSIPAAQSKMQGKMTEGMLLPYEKIFAELEKEKEQ